MTGIVLFFLVASLLIYCSTGGADFGAGILEAVIPKARKPQHRELVKKAISPVWETNHVWLIILIVILFVGFPVIYAQISTTFHIPLTLMLMGIICRGCAFVFRHYGSADEADSPIYSWIFSGSSVLTPIFLGIVMGSLVGGNIPTHPTNFYAAFVQPWANPFSLSVGIFTATIFAYLASVYMIDEAKDAGTAQFYRSLAGITQLVMVGVGAVVLVLGSLTSLRLIPLFFSHKISVLLFISATLIVAWLWRKTDSKPPISLRYVAATQVSMVILAWLWVVYPVVIRFDDGTALTVANNAGPVPISLLAGCLIVGSLIIFPSLAYLLKIFKFQNQV